MRFTTAKLLSTARLALLCAGLTTACSAGSTPKNGGGNPSGGVVDAGFGGPTPGTFGGPSAGNGGITTGDGAVCKGLQCQQQSCPSGGSTTISGTVYDPAGKNPLYNVVVYVPNSAPTPLPTGASCDSCGSLFSGNPVAVATTDAKGQFVLKDAPVGANIPLVAQVGKWRKPMTVPMVVACQDNPLPDKTVRLPKNHMEGDIPNIAIATGGADTLECLFRRVGVDASEYVPGPSPAGRLHIFQGNPTMGFLGGLFGGGGGGFGAAPTTSPAAPTASMALWNSVDELKKYDIVLLSCEGDETQAMNQQALHDYASAGGRVFASHFHYAWFNTGPYGTESLATWTPGSGNMGNINANIVTKLPNGAAFPKGQALLDWLGNVNALQNGELPIAAARHNADVAGMNMVSQPWIVADQNARPAGATEYFSFNTPTDAKVGPDGVAYCGRVVFSDLHVGAASGDVPAMPVPASCADADLSPQEKALEFMLFDLSSCVTPDDKAPPPPVIPQ